MQSMAIFSEFKAGAIVTVCEKKCETLDTSHTPQLPSCLRYVTTIQIIMYTCGFYLYYLSDVLLYWCLKEALFL